MFHLNKSCIALAVLLTLSAPPALGYPHVWSGSFGGTNAEYPTAVSANADGAVAVVGYFWGTADFGGGPMVSVGDSDIFVACYDAGGYPLWSKRLGGTSGDVGFGVFIQDDGSVLVTGYFAGSVDFGGGALVSNGGIDIFLAKYDANGNHVWSQSFGSTGFEAGVDVAVDASGNILFTGYIGDTVDFGGGGLTGPGGADIFLVKCDGNGGHIWSVTHGGTDTDSGWKLACTGGDVVLAGYFKGTADFGGGSLVSAGEADVYLAKYNASGGHVWSKRFGSTQNDQPAGVCVDGSGRVAITGFFQGTVDFGGGGLSSVNADDIFLAQYDAAGSHLWSQSFGGIAKDEVYGLAVDSGDNLFITGAFPNSIDFGGGVLTSTDPYNDVFVAGFDASGAHAWSAMFASTLDDAGQGIAVDGYDNAIITGIHETTIDFGGGPLTSDGFYDVFVAKFQSPTATALPDLDPTATGFALRQNNPNPFNPSTVIRYDVAGSGGHVLLRIYDASGRLVRTLVDAPRTAGEHEIFWYGRDNRGNEVASGVYFYRMSTPGFDATKRMVLLR